MLKNPTVDKLLIKIVAYMIKKKHSYSSFYVGVGDSSVGKRLAVQA